MGKYTVSAGGILTNCTCNYKHNETLVKSKDLIFLADEGHIFDGEFTIFGTNAQDTPLANEGNKLILRWGGSNPPFYDLVLNKEIKAIEGIFDPTIIYYSKSITNIEFSTFANCSINYERRENLRSNKDIIVTANVGYVFDPEIEYYILVGFFGTDKVYFINEGNRLVIDMSNPTFDPNNNVQMDINFIAIEGQSEPDEPELPKLNTFSRIYNISETELQELSLLRFIDGNFSEVDMSKFMNSLYILPFKISDNILDERRNIFLGKTDTTISSISLKSYILNVDLGIIEVPEIYNNIYDYINTSCILYLPYFDKIHLNNEYVINQSIAIDYSINLYTGCSTVNISSSFTDTIIESRTSLVTTNIPYVSNDNIMGTFSNSLKNNINKAYVEVVRNKPYDVVTPFGKNTIEYGRLGDYEGYLQCDNVVLESLATIKEKDEIIRLLNKGVFINEN